MNSKHILQSKTLWANVLIILIALFRQYGVESNGATLDEGTVTAIVAVVVNIAMRVVTKQPVHIS